MLFFSFQSFLEKKIGDFFYIKKNIHRKLKKYIYVHDLKFVYTSKFLLNLEFLKFKNCISIKLYRDFNRFSIKKKHFILEIVCENYNILH